MTRQVTCPDCGNKYNIAYGDTVECTCGHTWKPGEPAATKPRQFVVGGVRCGAWSDKGLAAPFVIWNNETKQFVPGFYAKKDHARAVADGLEAIANGSGEPAPHMPGAVMRQFPIELAGLQYKVGEYTADYSGLTPEEQGAVDKANDDLYARCAERFEQLRDAVSAEAAQSHRHPDGAAALQEAIDDRPDQTTTTALRAWLLSYYHLPPETVKRLFREKPSWLIGALDGFMMIIDVGAVWTGVDNLNSLDLRRIVCRAYAEDIDYVMFSFGGDALTGVPIGCYEEDWVGVDPHTLAVPENPVEGSAKAYDEGREWALSQAYNTLLEKAIKARRSTGRGSTPSMRQRAIDKADAYANAAAYVHALRYHDG